jgi:3-hydroxybutyryl-CoA dehydrogenase
MGSGIAQVLAVAGHVVSCVDVDPGALDRAREGIERGRFGLGSAVSRGLLSEGQAEAALERITLTPDLDVVATADLVIEAVPERLDLKIRLFRDLDRRAPGAAILASNSSGFPVAALAAATDRPDRVVVWHWASPAPVMKLAEIVRGPDTSDATVEVVVRLATSAGKHPVVVKDHPTVWGYVANRVYAAMIREAGAVVREGIASAEDVDRLMVDCFRWPTGPFGMAAGATQGWKGEGSGT